MATTFVKIATVTVGSGGAATIDFTSIPATYTDLCLKTTLRDETALIYGDGVIRFNNDSASNYSRLRLNGDGITASSSSQTTTGITGWNPNGATSTANTFCNSEMYIPNYLSSSQKSASIDCVVENNATTAYDFMVASLWTGTAAINRVSIVNLSSTFVQYSTATLYGIKNS
jgi:hypothetical protein